ncbi:hypothetical protein IPZ58_25520 [Streptomyces roseoverticillatus]|uniref:hypothetical protein n=1 Tax=Streptomyces roseoverticillatus TaxID=66429 RepID=UPI001F3BAEAD|nr:hypothetical protein [Streptomyces roseoverticillatus]MCF3104922.1 hypothetical protein [Streptomyces roseoverticillatus]
MSSPDDAPDDKPRVTIRCQDNASVGVMFCDQFSFDAHSVPPADADEARPRRLRCCPHHPDGRECHPMRRPAPARRVIAWRT